MPDLNADPELLAGFLDEASESLASLDSLFIQLEATPQERTTVEAIFRPIHSLKGNAAFFGFMAIKGLAHEMETLLDHIRKGRATATRQAIDILLAGLDGLKAVVVRLRDGASEVPDPAAHQALVDRVIAIATSALGEPAPPSAKPDWQRALADLELLVAAATGAPASAAATRLRALLGTQVETTSAKAVLQPATQSSLAELIATPCGGPPTAAFTSAMETALKELTRHGDPVAAEMVDAWSAMVPVLGWDPAVRDFLAERLPRLAAVPTALEAQAVVRVEAPGAAPATPQAQPVIKHDPAKSMRVAETTIDTFLHYVGELLVVNDLLEHLQRRAAGMPGCAAFARDFRRANEGFHALSNQLQRSIMSIRRVPVKPLLQKVPRLVRDIAQAKAKDIAVVINGEHVEVDKSLIELLDAPLTHMTRNAADHGVETVEGRRAAGKPDQGVITITAVEGDTNLVLTITDDGAGLNLPAIRRKGESLGLVQPGQVLGEQDIINLIFASGVSTATQVTDISGRGVGMDVVKRAVEEAGGAINVTSVPGHGSTFSITLPKGVTTQIITGYLARVRNHTYVLPLDRVRETFKVSPVDVERVTDRGRFIRRHDEILPVQVLAESLGLEALAWPAKGQPVVTVMARRRKLALAVDGVIGVQKVVIRPLKGLAAGCELFSGGALLGDGTVALVLDLDRLVEATTAP